MPLRMNYSVFALFILSAVSTLMAALPLYRKAAARGKGDTAKTAADRVTELEKQRDEVLANGKKLIDEKKGKEAVATLEKLLRQYEAEAGNVRELLRDARK